MLQWYQDAGERQMLLEKIAQTRILFVGTLLLHLILSQLGSSGAHPISGSFLAGSRRSCGAQGLVRRAGTKVAPACYLQVLCKEPEKIPQEIHHIPSQPLHALLHRKKHSQALPNSRHPAFLWICVKKSCWQPGRKGPSGWKFKPQGFLHRTSS